MLHLLTKCESGIVGGGAYFSYSFNKDCICLNDGPEQSPVECAIFEWSGHAWILFVNIMLEFMHNYPGR